MNKNVNKAIENLLMENEELLLRVVKEINCINGDLDDLDFFENDEYFFESFFTDKMELLRSAQYGNYNIHDDYVKFDGNGNLESGSFNYMIEGIKRQIDDVVSLCIEYYYKIDISEIREIIEEIEEEEQ